MAERISAAVAKAEDGSALEVVVRVAPISADYRDIALMWALAFVVLGLELILFSPLLIWPLWVIPLGAVFGGIGYWIGDRKQGAIRLLTTRDRRKVECIKAARVAFYEEAVSTTRDRTGVLLYCSVFEDEVILVEDHALGAYVTGAALAKVAAMGSLPDLDLTDRLLQMIDGLGKLGNELLPPRPDDTDELDNEPKIG